MDILTTPVQPSLEHFIRVTLEVGAPTQIGATANGVRRYVPILGGIFEGEGMRGKVLAGGGDWLLQRQDGSTLIDARYSLETDHGQIIYIQDRGFRHGPEQVMARLAAGEAVDPSEYYFRTSATLETSAPELMWLNQTLFVGSGMRKAANVIVDFYITE
ncbi:DUF3237 domain-containing protein [Aurantivibrio plasticivorans]